MRLVKGREDATDILRADANAAVLDLAAQSAVFPSGHEDDAAGVGKFHGVIQ